MAAKYTTKIDDDVMSVLRRSGIACNMLTLPEQLDRALYVKVDKVLKAMGGKWNRGKKAHVFASDPRDVLGLAMETGSITDTAKKLQQFFTPEALAADVVERAHILPGMRVLEPSAGSGSLVSEIEFWTDASNIHCVELDDKLVENLRARGYSVLQKDFLTVDPSPVYDRVVMNPPFAGDQDVRHVTHAIKFLKSGGILVAIMGAGMKSNEWKETREFRKLVEALGGTIEDLPEGSFKDSGTMVNTVLVTVKAR